MSNTLNIEDWIKDIFTNNNIPNDIIALNFGLFESTDGKAVYCTGSTEYDDEDPDWACNEDFSPNEKYFQPNETISNLDDEEFESTICDLIEQVLENNANSIPKSVNHICCGFDDGDLTLLWTR